ncbi:Hint domain-containing protein [Rhodobacter sp. SY28-1]|uniref:Hint domain-containing protein n=1 Tax=Rhodobacter sp. SY28-1 TaxID=2562317 RepID=UPI0010BF9796|nr:Hint domain-containing protein [Rhodobacter sp. SY28-1]
MATFSLWAREDSITANNSTLNPIGTNQAPTTELIFTDNGTGDLSLEFNGGLPDPDTQVIIGGTAYDFTVVLTGILPDNSQVPATLVGRTVAVITVVIDGEVHEYFFVLGAPPATFDEMDDIGNGAIPLTTVDPDPPPFCFAKGTEIATPSGDRLVETLRSGDSVLTEDGRSVTIGWIGTSRYSRRRASGDIRLRPVHVRAHAFGQGLPRRDLVVSRQHRIVIESSACELFFGSNRAFVVAGHLPELLAASPEPEEDVIYFHILLETHEILLANGLPAESFQPARRMIETLSEASRQSLDEVLEVLGTDDMLARPDALPTLNRREARVVFASQVGVRSSEPVELRAAVTVN